jgi:hypothetical protein
MRARKTATLGVTPLFLRSSTRRPLVLLLVLSHLTRPGPGPCQHITPSSSSSSQSIFHPPSFPFPSHRGRLPSWFGLHKGSHAALMSVTKRVSNWAGVAQSRAHSYTRPITERRWVNRPCYFLPRSQCGKLLKRSDHASKLKYDMPAVSTR